mgnify:CR=1 FL=1
MLLALDIGNSTIVAALFDSEKKLAETIAPSAVQRSREEAWDIIQSLIRQTNDPARGIRGVGISSVVPFLTQLFSSLTKEKVGIEPLVVSAALDLGINIHYDGPTMLGSDRISSAVAAFAKYGRRLDSASEPLIVVDFGTATTYGVVGANGDFLGGVISLGVKSTAEALYRRAAQLPSFEIQMPEKAIATNTLDAMQAGIMFSTVDAVEGMVKRIRKELGVEAKVIATGGLSTMMSKQTTTFDAVEPDLVLEGVRLIHERLSPRL